MITPTHATTFMGGDPREEINLPHLPCYATAVAGDVKKINLAKPTLPLAECIPKCLSFLSQSANDSNASNDYTRTTHLPYPLGAKASEGMEVSASMLLFPDTRNLTPDTLRFVAWNLIFAYAPPHQYSSNPILQFLHLKISEIPPSPPKKAF